jgi:hypothetical protein
VSSNLAGDATFHLLRELSRLDTGPMNTDDVIRDFATTGGTLPRASMQWALENWDAAVPRFIELLDRCTDGIDRSEETKNALFFIIHLFGEKRETRAFHALCRLLKSSDDVDSILADAITATLCGVLICTYDGDMGVLKEVIESSTTFEFARAAALEAMAYLTRTGALTDDDMRAYMLHLLAEMRPQAAGFVWTAWTLTVANLGYQDYAGQVEQLFDRGFVPHHDMSMRNFNEQLRRTLDDPARMAGFKHDRIGPFTDTVGTLSTWYGFSEQAKLDVARRAAKAEAETFALPDRDEPYINPHRHVGRNDPCPCGSGKKYKKCCLE